MKSEKPRAIRLADYRPPAYLIDKVDLDFALHPSATRVRARLKVRANPDAAVPAGPLRLDGEQFQLGRISIDGVELTPRDYQRDAVSLTVLKPPSGPFTIETTSTINPDDNKALQGLYRSRGVYCTQCEAQGFRRITYFLDRPDVLSVYAVRVEADAEEAPVLLANGNPVERGTLDRGRRHYAVWRDPHPKPCYLFALVAGNLSPVASGFTTRSGRKVDLKIYVEHGKESRAAWAMDSLKRAMRWDETRFGREYDLDVFNIVAVSDFNMGAMENKGLNIFNDRLILASAETATDSMFEAIESVVAHEYFHNWTGNRVTCRDWFQLSLKEGLTVFRDQEFSADIGSRPVKRIRDVRGLRAAQFAEDAGPMAHPVRPESYLEIDNFYTPTVYQKGAEVVRLLQTAIGTEAFKRGLSLYIARHDNSAATIEDFSGAMADASGVDLGAFAGWYAQAGTPIVTVTDSYDAAAQRYTLTLRQETPPTAGQPEKRPLPIPVAMGLLGANGAALPTRLAGEATTQDGTRLLRLDAAEQTFVFEDVPSPPTPSLLRGFSAPVRLNGIARERLRFLAVHDTDPFVRWDSGQQYATALILDRVADPGAPFDPALADAVQRTLAASDADPAFAAEALILPGESVVADVMDIAEPLAIHDARQSLRREIGQRCGDALRATYARLADPGPYRIDGASIGRRALRNACLAYLAAAGDTALAAAQFREATNMTDSLAALSLLADSDTPEAATALAAFHARWRGDALVLDKWFAVQAMASRPDTLGRVAALYAHPDFDLRNPNRARALIGSFAAGNPRWFHDASGQGYRFLADAVMALDPLNAMTAARMVGGLGRWRRQNAARAALMRAELERILALPGLSRGTFEQVSKGLAA